MTTFRMNMKGEYVPESRGPRIEIRSRDVNKGIGTFGAQHLYIIFTFSDGKEYIIRGGPKNDNMIVDDLYIVECLLDKQYKHLFGNDDTEKYWTHTIPGSEYFTDEQIQYYVNTIAIMAEYINAQMYDYKLPFGENVQNSNTIVKFLIERAGLPFALPKDSNGNYVWAPGVDGQLAHTTLDKAMKVLANLADSTIRDRVLLSAALGVEFLFDRDYRERTASAQNAENFANNFGRGDVPPSSSPTKGPTSGPSVPPTNFPTKGPSGPMPSSGGSSRGGQAPFAPTSSTPARTYTPPITTRANQPGFAPSFNAPTFNTPFGQPNSAPTFRNNPEHQKTEEAQALLAFHNCERHRHCELLCNQDKKILELSIGKYGIELGP